MPIASKKFEHIARGCISVTATAKTAHRFFGAIPRTPPRCSRPLSRRDPSEEDKVQVRRLVEVSPSEMDYGAILQGFNGNSVPGNN